MLVTCVLSPVNSRHPHMALGVSTGVRKGLMLSLPLEAQCAQTLSHGNIEKSHIHLNDHATLTNNK